MPTHDDYNAIYGGKYQSAADAGSWPGGKKRVKIAKVEKEYLRQDGGNVTRPKLVLYFVGLDKGLVLNKTNAATIKDALGADPANWVGAVVELVVESVTFAGKPVNGLRLKVLPKPTAPVAVTPAPVPTKPAPAQAAPEPNDDPSDWTPDENWVRDDDVS
jgi:hypothetical protein